jgi:hypothetical protein
MTDYDGIDRRGSPTTAGRAFTEATSNDTGSANRRVPHRPARKMRSILRGYRKPLHPKYPLM